MSYSSVAAKVAQQKREQPERYCPTPRCLWQTDGRHCPRHAPRVSNPEDGDAMKAAREAFATVPLPVQSFAEANGRLAEAFGRYLTMRNYASSTRQIYAHTLRKFLDFLASQSVLDADRRTVRQFITQHRLDGGSAGSVHHLRCALRAFYKFLVIGCVARTSPAQFIEIPKIPKTLPRCPSEKEIEAILAAATSPRDRAILELLYASGLRLSELAKLRVSDLNLNSGTLRVEVARAIKTGSQCAVQKLWKHFMLIWAAERAEPFS